MLGIQWRCPDSLARKPSELSERHPRAATQEPHQERLLLKGYGTSWKFQFPHSRSPRWLRVAEVSARREPVLRSRTCRVFPSLPPSNASCSSCSLSSGTSRRSAEDSLTRCEDGPDGTTHRVDEAFSCGPILMDDPEPRRPASHRRFF